MTKRICVIGNAELLSNSTQFVDNSEVVIRINDCKNYTGLSGRKTDLVFVDNTGEPARRLAVNAPFQNQELFSHVDKFVFVRDIKVHRRFLLATEQERYLNLIDDHADEIVHHNEILSNRTDKLSKKFNLDVFRAIWQERKRRWIPGPSCIVDYRPPPLLALRAARLTGTGCWASAPSLISPLAIFSKSGCHFSA